jgi:UDP-N-acetylglucosamine 4,6-dehydratase
VKIVDLARAMAASLPLKIVGIRPGEKLHEVMCPSDDSHLTLEFDDHFVICPSIQFVDQVDFRRNNLAERGEAVEQGFEFNSGKNAHFLNVEEIVAMNRAASTR